MMKLRLMYLMMVLLRSLASSSTPNKFSNKTLTFPALNHLNCLTFNVRRDHNGNWIRPWQKHELLPPPIHKDANVKAQNKSNGCSCSISLAHQDNFLKDKLAARWQDIGINDIKCNHEEAEGQNVFPDQFEKRSSPSEKQFEKSSTVGHIRAVSHCHFQG